MTMNTSLPTIADWRKNYERGELLEAQAPADPLALFDTWLQDAVKANCPEPNAMTLATVGSDLRPSTRIVLIKGYDASGICWFTSYASRKGTELAGNPFAALQFHWVELERTVRIEGRVEKMSAAESDAYFHSRPLASRISAITSPQSQVVPSREWLDDRAAEIAATAGDSPQRPQDWGGYRLVPDRWQFWQGRRSRLHDRLAYTLGSAQQWLISRLAP
jgi:pyridoxamine 5'-phosphate oxidase